MFRAARQLGLLAAIVAALALAATASATTVTSPEGSAYTGKFNGVDEGGHIVLDNTIAPIACDSTFESQFGAHGSGQTAQGTMTLLRFSGCTNNWHMTVVAGGTFEVHAGEEASDGTLTSSGATIEATRFGIVCRYQTSGTDLGTITGGHPATLDLEGELPFHSGSGLCGSEPAPFTGAYMVSSPTLLFVDQ